MTRMTIALFVSLVASVVIIATAAMAGTNGVCIHDPVAGTFCGGTPVDTSERPK